MSTRAIPCSYHRDAGVVHDVDSLIANADGRSTLISGVTKLDREGLVYKSNTTNDSFKVISNRWLYKTGE